MAQKSQWTKLKDKQPPMFEEIWLTVTIKGTPEVKKGQRRDKGIIEVWDAWQYGSLLYKEEAATIVAWMPITKPEPYEVD